ncbi:MAG: hypothetical protein MZV49_18535 [Rhodopseudomonas palustris]|nr:hypothetical protein [Rhodopseudomonas palustris]
MAFEPIDTLGAARHARRSAARIGGMIASGLAGPTPHQGRAPRATICSAADSGVGLWRAIQDRRQGGEERHRLRPVQAAGRLAGARSAVMTEVTRQGDAQAPKPRTVLLFGLDEDGGRAGR